MNLAAIETIPPHALPSERLLKALDQVALVTANYGDADSIRNSIADWCEFLGGRPGQIIHVESGDMKSQQVAFESYKDGLIDKLVLWQPRHFDNTKDTGYIAEHAAPALATKPYVLFFKVDTLPYREGHEDWLCEAIEHLERPDTFAVGGSFNLDSRHHEAWPGWYFSDRCSENFSLMKRERFIGAMQEYGGPFICSGFQDASPAGPVTSQTHRYFVELAFVSYMQKHGLYTLARVEDPTWTIFHTNVHDPQLQRVRENFRARKNINKFMNAKGFSAKLPEQSVFYGDPPAFRRSLRKRIQVAFGASPAGGVWRAMKRAMGVSRGMA